MDQWCNRQWPEPNPPALSGGSVQHGFSAAVTSEPSLGVDSAADKRYSSDRSNKMSIIQERTVLALEAIQSAFGTEAGADSVDLFLTHHSEELPNSYWVEHLSLENPTPANILSLLVLRGSWGKGDIENFDFTLPGDVTDYVLSVHFDAAGQIDGIAMES